MKDQQTSRWRKWLEQALNERRRLNAQWCLLTDSSPSSEREKLSRLIDDNLQRVAILEKIVGAPRKG